MKKTTRKARKKHFCSSCFGSIKKGEMYKFRRCVFVDDDNTVFSYEQKECQSCYDPTPKQKYKKQQHDIRAAKRKENCPDKDFRPVWQGGWDTALGCADGGDCIDECHHACNLNC